MARFEALEVSIQLVHALAPHLKFIARTNRDLADQLRRAATSAASCIAEGGRRVGKDRWHLFRTAEGSAAEVHAQLRIAIALGDVDETAAADALALADRTVAVCVGLTRKQR